MSRKTRENAIFQIRSRRKDRQNRQSNYPGGRHELEAAKPTNQILKYL